MTGASSTKRADWREIHRDLIRRISDREWPAGSLIPGEEALAREYDCARTTVNKALNTLAEAGLVVRRRKAGTRVAEAPTRHARLAIPLIREEIEATGAAYGYRLLNAGAATPDSAPAGQFASDTRLVHVRAVHFADDRPYVLETRWIDTALVPAASDPAAFRDISANEWLVRHAPYAGGEMVMSAAPASDAEAKTLNVDPQSPVFRVERFTRAPSRQGSDGTSGQVVTFARLSYAPDRRLRLSI